MASIYLNPEGYENSTSSFYHFYHKLLDKRGIILFKEEANLSIDEVYILQVCRKYLRGILNQPYDIVIREYDEWIKDCYKLYGFHVANKYHSLIGLSKNRNPEGKTFLHEFGHVLSWASIYSKNSWSKAIEYYKAHSWAYEELVASLYGLKIAKKLGLSNLVWRFLEDVEHYDMIAYPAIKGIRNGQAVQETRVVANLIPNDSEW